MSTESLPAQEFELQDGGRLFVATTGAKDVVAIEGSVLGGENMLPVTLDVVPSLAAELLDAGTKKKNKQVIRDALALRGASLSFSSGGDRTYFSGQCFPEDLPFLLSTITECLKGAAFPVGEVQNAKARELGELSDEKSNTRAVAERAFSELIYEPTHVNYLRPLVQEESALKKVTRANLEAFRKMLGRGGLVLAVTGDVTASVVRKSVEAAFSALSAGTHEAPEKKLNTKRSTNDRKLMPIKDKANVDVLMGASLGIRRQDPLYQPLNVLTQMLGGSASSHLFQTVRERDGLTYGVYAMLSGLSDGADGCFKVWATFSPALYAVAVEKLESEIREFVRMGVTEEALVRRQQEMTGSYLVSLSTTRGLASALHSLGILGKELSYLTEYPNIIRAVSHADIKNAADGIPLDRLSLVAAGTFESPKK